MLHKHLQDGDIFNKWKARSWQGAYVGPSTCHASNIPLIYNPTTTHMSPQFHVVYDEDFILVVPLPSTAAADALLDKLYKKAFWMHDHNNPLLTDSYPFTTFWDQSIPTKPADHGRK
jgi:hypothetical protein